MHKIVLSIAILMLSATLHATAIDGFAPSGPNVSKDAAVAIYMSQLSGSDTTQTVAYDQHGNLLWVTLTNNGVVKVLPFGLLANKVNVATASTGGPKADAIACPCHSVVIYDGPNGTVIAIYDANGNIAQIIQLPPRMVQK